jgi:hypothetical protein
MGSYLQQYGVDDARRARSIKIIVLIGFGLLILAIAAYFFFHNFFEKRVVIGFLEDVNAHKYQEAYRKWGCADTHPCPNYDFNRFMEDWGPAKHTRSPWEIASVDGCKSFVTVNVKAEGAELQSLSVERRDRSLGYAPSPECQERQWRWKQFFARLFHRGGSQSQ